MMLRAVASFSLLLSVALADNECQMCDKMQFTAEGGLEMEYSRYMGEWKKVDHYDGRPVYACPGMDCQGLDRMMAWIDNQWRIVDCLPSSIDCPDCAQACGGSHAEIYSNGAEDSNSCPYDSIEPWSYCVGDIIAGIGGGCTEYALDETAKFTCVI